MKPNSKVTDSMIAGAVVMTVGWALDAYWEAWIPPPDVVGQGIVLLAMAAVGYIFPERRA